MQCKRCSKDILRQFGSGRFCSVACSNTRTFSTETRAKISSTLSNKCTGHYCAECSKRLTSKRKHGLCKACLSVSAKWRLQISNTAKHNKLSGGYRRSSGRGIKTTYFSDIAGTVHLQSSWELAYAKYLDKESIKWVRNTKKFEYSDSKGILRHYIPDFYLIDSDEFIEIKGYATADDYRKWSVMPNLTVLFREDLHKLGLVV